MDLGTIEAKAHECLRQMFGTDAQFLEGQLEAIKAIFEKKKLLLVQRTGWGKSVVYFIATKINRSMGKGMTLVISPLIALMRDQVENANKLGIVAETINSENEINWDAIFTKIEADLCDLLLVSPERLGNEDFLKKMPWRKVGMFVVDEAHCISEWGHDFRPDYQRIVKMLSFLPSNIPIVATTATANERVTHDIKQQLGEDLQVMRGNLVRESLKIQIIHMPSRAERMAWIAENLCKMPGSGIIYTLTISDAEHLASWLRMCGYAVESYHSASKNRENLENKLKANEIKALVATSALGMGFDKPDIGFVIHFQRPQNIVNYYQQIGRAGRKLDEAYIVLLVGEEDDEICQHFIESAFPTQDEVSLILRAIERSPNGLRFTDLLSVVNMPADKVEKAIKYLSVIECIKCIKKDRSSYYYPTFRSWKPDLTKSELIKKKRYEELQKMKEFTTTKDCYMKFIVEELNDQPGEPCGKCTNCRKTLYFPDKVLNTDLIQEAEETLNAGFTISPKKKLGNSKNPYPNEVGKAMTLYGASKYGKYVQQDKYEVGRFREELVEMAAQFIKRWGILTPTTWITFVPSLRRPNLVKDFAQRLAKKLGIPCVEAIVKSKNVAEQKEMNNYIKKYLNAMESFDVPRNVPNGPVILVDDVVDSGWTFTVCGFKLREKGSGLVYPFALATTKGGFSYANE